MQKGHRLFKLTTYIRVYLEALMYILVTPINEVYHFEIDGPVDFKSYIISVLCTLFIVGM